MSEPFTHPELHSDELTVWVDNLKAADAGTYWDRAKKAWAYPDTAPAAAVSNEYKQGWYDGYHAAKNSA
jgi:hypothetical protein